MKLAIMQPYFLPYIGYWQLMNTADIFVLYDNIQYTKKGWINRNRYLYDGVDKYLTIPLKKDSDFLNVIDRSISNDFNCDDLYRKLEAAYKKAPYWSNVDKLLQKILYYKDDNLFNYIKNSIICTRELLDIKSKLIISSEVNIDHINLHKEEKVKAICKRFNADTYINPESGVKLYSKSDFEKEGINLKFLKVDEDIRYQQFNYKWCPNLSIIDVLAFNSINDTKKMLDKYTII